MIIFNFYMSAITCKELINIFEKIGGNLVCVHDTKTCTLLPQNINAIIEPTNSVDIDMLLSGFAYSGSFERYVTMLPESEKSKKDIFVADKLYRYQEKNTGGFSIEFAKDNYGFIKPK